MVAAAPETERAGAWVSGGMRFPTSVSQRDDLLASAGRWRPESWNLAMPPEGSGECVHDVIGAQVERAPEAVAVQVGAAAVTYRQLDDRANAIASRLVHAGAAPGTVVAMLLERTPDLVATMLGILKSGAAFLPLDPRQPPARHAFCLADAGVSIVVTDSEMRTGVPGIETTVINLGHLGRQLPGSAAVLPAVSPAELAYVMYTSGSTGAPKGVLIEHRGVTNLMRTLFREIGVGAADTVLSVAAISFDMAPGDIFCALSAGARLVLATAEQASSPAELGRLIDRSAASFMCATPTTWASLVAAGWGGNPRLTALAGGETLTDGLARALQRRCGSVWNDYGPTEATVITTLTQLTEGDTVTVGRPLPNVQVYITDDCGRPAPVGVAGEITIGGVGVARGYLNRPDQQARRFADDPLHPGGRLYRTGDRGRFLPDGSLQYLGRDDDQLKIRGMRIEPGEIESALLEHPAVGSCAVVGRQAPNGEQQLVAYLVSRSPGPSDAEIRAWLRCRLPEHLVPSAYVPLRALPTTANGKLDRAALPPPSLWVAPPVAALPPHSDTEARIAALWADLLGFPVVDVHTDFFDVGGHSLLATRLLAEVQRIWGVGLSVAEFADRGRTIAGLAAWLDTACCSRAGEGASGVPLHFIFASPTSAMSARHFATLGVARPLHPLIPEQPAGRFDRSVTIEQHARRALATIRTRQPEGPLTLVGYSIGGVVAYETARQAREAGQEVAWLGVVDTVAPPLVRLLGAELTLRSRASRLRRRLARQRWAKCAELALRPFGRYDPFDYHGAAEITCRYRQTGHDVPLHLFVSADTAADVQSAHLGWAEFHPGPLTAHRLGGDHGAVLRLPEAAELARMMRESLPQAS